MQIPEADIEDVPSYSGDLSILDLKTEYRSLKDDPVDCFYRPCLRNANSYSRAVGYFRSTVFVVVGSAIIEFARRGGKIRLICSPDLVDDDVEQIVRGYARREEALAEDLIAQFDAMMSNTETALGARTLATLIATGVLEVRLAERRDRRGIYHEKIGLFEDSLGNKVSFKGSTNETWGGWHRHGNFESIEVFCDWRGGLEQTRVDHHATHFQSLWNQDDPDVEVSQFPKTAAEYIIRYAAKRLDDLVVEPNYVAKQRRSALPHQQSAIDGWIAQGRRGIFEHATGSGKTFTASLALREHLMAGRPAIVLVPSRLLLEQWAKEMREEIPEAVVLMAGGGHDRWKGSRRITSMTDSDSSLGPRLVIALMPTAASDEFRSGIVQGRHLLVVADEVHQIGSANNSRFFAIDAGARLGLSATPKRYGDPDGTQRILDYFGAVVPPPITLADAVASGRLVDYEYFPHTIHLNATEADEWSKISKDIRHEMARQKADESGRRPMSERAKMLLIKRSRIAKKAVAKTQLAVELLSQRFEESQSWLVYCEDGGQLADVIIALREIGLSPIEYHSGMVGDRDATMEWFRAFGGILVSIRCLDEGVDIPSVSHALILASSQNPRQFIQRRGRVLRRSQDKDLAVIHDAIVIPTSAEDDADQMSLLRAELMRSVEFATHALNRAASAELREVAIQLGINPDEIADAEGEEEDDG